jgi:hypothetical protein
VSTDPLCQCQRQMFCRTHGGSYLKVHHNRHEDVYGSSREQSGGSCHRSQCSSSLAGVQMLLQHVQSAISADTQAMAATET